VFRPVYLANTASSPWKLWLLAMAVTFFEAVARDRTKASGLPKFKSRFYNNPGLWRAANQCSVLLNQRDFQRRLKIERPATVQTLRQHEGAGDRRGRLDAAGNTGFN